MTVEKYVEKGWERSQSFIEELKHVDRLSFTNWKASKRVMRQINVFPLRMKIPKTRNHGKVKMGRQTNGKVNSNLTFKERQMRECLEDKCNDKVVEPIKKIHKDYFHFTAQCTFSNKLSITRGELLMGFSSHL